MKVALYARVSIPREGENPRAQDPENQLISLRRFVAEQGLSVHAEYIDRISGASRARPGLGQLLRDAKGHRFELVLCTKVDRFARSVSHLYTLLEDLQSIGIKVRFIDQPEASTDTPQGELVLGILGHVSQFERSLISSRTKAGIERYRLEQGRWGRKRADISSEEIVALRQQGLSIREISVRLETSKGTVHSRLRSIKGTSETSKETVAPEGGSE